MSRKTWLGLASAATLAAALGASCGDGFGGVLISSAKEVEIGKGVDLEIEGEFKILEDTDPVARWAQQLVGGLVEGSRSFRDPAEIGGYKVEVIADDALVNAFAAPGGFTYLTTALIAESTTCAEIAGVMGHELAHVTERHSVKMIEDQFAAAQLTAFFLGEGLAADAASIIYSFMASTQFSQDHEEEADHVGLQISFNGGYNPYGLADFFSKLLALEGTSGGFRIPTFLSSHPATGERVKAVGTEIQRRYGDAVKPGTTQTYACANTDLTLEEVKARIAAGQLAIRAGTGTKPPSR